MLDGCFIANNLKIEEGIFLEEIFTLFFFQVGYTIIGACTDGTRKYSICSSYIACLSCMVIKDEI
jgi:hypothetical protein